MSGSMAALGWCSRRRSRVITYWSTNRVIGVKICRRSSGGRGEYAGVRVCVYGERMARFGRSVVCWMSKR